MPPAAHAQHSLQEKRGGLFCRPGYVTQARSESKDASAADKVRMETGIAGGDTGDDRVERQNGGQAPAGGRPVGRSPKGAAGLAGEMLDSLRIA